MGILGQQAGMAPFHKSIHFTPFNTLPPRPGFKTCHNFHSLPLLAPKMLYRIGSHRDFHPNPTQTQTHPVIDRKHFCLWTWEMESHLKIATVKNQWNKTFIFKKYFCRQWQRQRQMQRLEKTQHVLYFLKAHTLRISNMILRGGQSK